MNQNYYVPNNGYRQMGYGPQNMYQQPNMVYQQPNNMQQQQISQQQIQQQIIGLQGKSVDGIEVVKAMDIPLDRKCKLFSIN